MAQWLRTLAVLPEDLGSVPSTHSSQPSVTLVLGDLMCASGFHSYIHPCGTHKLMQAEAHICMCACTHTHTQITLKKEKRQLSSGHTFSPRTRETEADRSLLVQGQPGLQSGFQDSHGCYTEKPCLEKKRAVGEG